MQMDKDCNPHFALNVIGPDQSAHRVAVGITSHTSAAVTGHAIRSVLNHADHVTTFYADAQWGV